MMEVMVMAMVVVRTIMMAMIIVMFMVAMNSIWQSTS